MDYKLTRRMALGALLGGSAAACTPQGPEEYSSERGRAGGTFAHGIASGDPLTDRVILWTRITPEDPRIDDIPVSWEISDSKAFTTVISSGEVPASKAKNRTVKVDAGGLNSGTEYFYRFKSGEQTSPIGRTKTLPDGAVENVRFAVVSCSNWQQGYFNVYDHIARSGEFDAILHLGDYYYEYDTSKANDAMTQAGRLHEPRHEIVTLDDYRIRHAQYRSDPGLQAVTSQMPVIAIWDDHESSNDSWRDGAENHTSDEGDWDDRKQAAMRAYYEWMPIRDPEPSKGKEFLYRAFEWGDLLTLCTTETRLLARGEPVIIEDHYDLITSEGGLEKFQNEILNDPNRNMMGQDQIDWITNQFSKSKDAGKPWRLLANQVLLGRLITPDLSPHVNESAIESIEKQWAGIRDFVGLSSYGLPVYPDSWDGYPVARERFYSSLQQAGVEDILVVTGDSHEFWANDLTNDAGDKMGVELGTTSVSSDTLAVFLGDATEDYALLMTQTNKDVRYYDPLTSGYLDLTLTPRRAEVRMISVDTTHKPEYTAVESAKFSVVPTADSLKLTSPSGLKVKQHALFHGIGD